MILGRQLESEEEVGGWGVRGTTNSCFPLCTSPSLSLGGGDGGEKRMTPHPFSFQTALWGLARRGQSGVGNGCSLEWVCSAVSQSGGHGTLQPSDELADRWQISLCPRSRHSFPGPQAQKRMSFSYCLNPR